MKNKIKRNNNNWKIIIIKIMKFLELLKKSMDF